MADGPSGRGSSPRRRASTGSSTPRAGARPVAGPRRGGTRGRSTGEARPAARPRFTGRAAVLVLVLVLLAVSYASSMRAFLEQRHHLAGLRASISESQSEVDRLTRERQRWKDPAYVRTLTHQRFGWVLPGEIGFQVLDEHGKPLGHTDSLSPADSVAEATRPQWWASAWGSMVAAGRPRADRAPKPATRIQAPSSGSAGGAGGAQP